MCVYREGFNPTLVRFNGRPQPHHTPFRVGFNPTLVRFNGASLYLDVSYCSEFQSPTGSIQRQKRKSLTRLSNAVSIPHWFDSTHCDSCDAYDAMGVSIPHWFDSTAVDVDAYRSPVVVS